LFGHRHLIGLGGKSPLQTYCLADNHVKNDQRTLEHCVQCMILLNL
jgi:hypothetical protein